MLLWCCLLVSVFSARADGPDDAFTSLASVEKLILIEREYGQKLLQFKQNLTLAYNLINKYIAEFSSLPLEDPNLLSKDPIFMFQMVRRLGIDYRILRETLKIQISAHLQRGVAMPTRTEAFNSAVQLVQLQSLYNLSSYQLAIGKIYDTDSYTRLTADDMILLHEGLKISKYGFNENTLWQTLATYRLLQEAGIFNNEQIIKTTEGIQRLYRQEQPTSPASKSDETPQSSNVSSTQALDDSTTDDINVSFSEIPENETTVPSSSDTSNGTSFNLLSMLHQTMSKTNVTEKMKSTENETPTKPTQDDERLRARGGRYWSLCNGIKLLEPREEADLKCELTTLKQPFFFLRRVKREMLCRRPPVFLFHDFLGAEEAQLVKRLSLDKLERSGVLNADGSSSIYSPHRISKTAWLHDNEHPIIEDLSRRIGMLTGLITHKNMSAAEEFQVVSYGLGGEYFFHWDETPSVDQTMKLLMPDSMGGRIATFLIFLEDVKYGGHTAFPDIGIYVKPQKGTALMWYNMFLNGSVDDRTIHGGCPVLYGSKWISNKWIHYKAQTFKHSCGLTNEDEHFFLES